MYTPVSLSTHIYIHAYIHMHILTCFWRSTQKKGVNTHKRSKGAFPSPIPKEWNLCPSFVLSQKHKAREAIPA